MDKITPKFATTKELEFWEKIYAASISSGELGLAACSMADKALGRRQERMTDDLNELESVDDLGEE